MTNNSYSRTAQRAVSKALLLAFMVLPGCAHSLIEGTQVRDTEENREIIAVLDELLAALENRDIGRLKALVSRTYFEDMGTADPGDDYGYETLTGKVLPKSLNRTKELYVKFRVHEVVVDGDQAHADLRYSSRAKIDLPSGAIWDSHKEFNRVEMTREDGRWMIISGL